uniref:MD-2-related lipid-recognition domain-containing protein n=1 Tax=Anopheles culicifacies TaxID=139723 RepID=A0A182MR59_9DIPT
MHYCQLDTYRNGSQVAGVVLEVLRNLQKVYVAGGLYTQYFRTRTQLLATTLEYCPATNNNQLTVRNAASKFALDYAQEHIPQMLVDCPMRAGQLFNITGVRIEDSMPLLVKRLDCTNEQSKASVLLQCTVHTCRNEPQVVNVLLDILEPTTKLVVALNLYTQYYTSKNLLYGTSFEYCELTKNANTQINPVTRIALNIAQENFPQVLKQCPLHGLINVTGLAVNSKLVPPYAPQGSYYFNIRAANKRNQTIVACTAEFQILQKPLLTRTLSMFGGGRLL